jgi:N-acyl homoserine lactone hydrolase
MEYRIYPIPTCRLKLDKGVFTYLKNYGEWEWVPVYAWLIMGASEPILVDTGCQTKEFQKHSHLNRGLEDLALIEESLQHLGVSASDIRTIIVTHLHTDHMLNAKRFPQAKFIVQTEELKFARNPHPLFSKSFPSDLYEGLRFETFSGDTEILPGIEIIFTPGHTPGSQSVAIMTNEGKVALAGFCSLDENFAESGDIIPGIHFDPVRAYDSLVRLRKITTNILPLHSQRLLGSRCIPSDEIR